MAFLPAGDVSHRDFVSHAWADYPIKDILVRMDDAYQRIKRPERCDRLPPAQSHRGATKRALAIIRANLDYARLRPTDLASASDKNASF